jgi:NAD(P)-dependent dehydrogenase (short-subunit alcohol dehydrogenase family)
MRDLGISRTLDGVEIRGRHVVVTGAAGGIGRALARRMAAEGARAVVVADLDATGAATVAAEIGGFAAGVDVGREDDIQRLIAGATERSGPIDVFFSNAGLAGPGEGPEAADAAWDLLWRVHVMAHIWAARALVPQMVARGEGYLVNTASAAGLLTSVSAMPYTVTKHAAVAVAEWLAITYRDAGVRVSCLCPQAVQTEMLEAAKADPVGGAILLAGGILTPDEVAAAVVEGIRQEAFFILPHREVATYAQRKAADPDRWLAKMRELVRGRR